MNIHILDYKIKDAEHSLVTLFLDGREEKQTLEVFALEQSGLRDGLFPILNCTCGEWGCGGFWVEVKHEGDEIIWEKIRIYESDKDLPRLHVKTPIVFHKKEYLDLITRLLTERGSNPILKNGYEMEKKHFEKTGKFYWDGSFASN